MIPTIGRFVKLPALLLCCIFGVGSAVAQDELPAVEDPSSAPAGEAQSNPSPEEATAVEPQLPIADSPAGVAHEIQFTTKDEVLISGTYTRSPVREDSDTVILIHEKKSDRHQWDSFTPMLLENGYSVLALDMRGYGASKNKKDGTTLESSDFERRPQSQVFTEMHQDVESAIEWLEENRLAFTERIFLVGTIVGGSVAGQVAASNGFKITGAVLVSPGTNESWIDLRVEMQKIQGRPYLLISADGDPASSNALLEIKRVNESVIRYVVPGGPTDRGRLLLDREDVRNRIVTYLMTLR